ncbi:hypothetical protein PLICRDRAFT_47263 [Plicaturopsis crispa FD-325 SS-3]|uniref:Uncharacterized protein n=1 Tax=Plicaturopsis crispa FD-325 SS-3 TaxID=944288 RepID=A0A0C9T5J8_PLICR|nr:hypothetical protein PLICRDRAFT_47263 [Plicaturopsis crispa FD-325 SS-3]
MPYVAPNSSPPIGHQHTMNPAILSDNNRISDANSMPQVLEASSSKIPIVTLKEDTMSDLMAARLVMSFLGHILFLKNQVPFPVTQLTRIPGGQKNLRALKKREELLASLDTLASHLNTTFTALSTALALASSNAEEEPSGLPGDATPHAKSGSAYLAIALGASVGTSRARVMLGLDGLEVKIWGARDDDEDAVPDYDESDSDSEAGSGSEDEDEDDTSEEAESDCDSENETASASSHAHSSSSSSPHPPSRTPSPSFDLPPPPNRSLPNPLPPPRPSQSRTVSYAQQQDAHVAAERLLSRTLATAASADENATDFSAELAPTQTHLLLRAPRRFAHPAWTPQPRLAGTMDTVLREFRAEMSGSDNGGKAKKKAKSVEGVWITCRGREYTGRGAEEEDEIAPKEEDELIWWAWDGKLVGFSDW